MEELLTLQEACKYLKINRMTLYKMAWSGKVPVYRVGRQWRFKKAVLDEWLENPEAFKRVPQKDKNIQKKHIFLTGATGFLGANLAYKLLKEGYSLKLLARRKGNESAQARIDKALLELCNDDPDEFNRIKEKVAVVEGDVTKSDMLGVSKKLLKDLSNDVCDLFHCAAFMSFDKEKQKELFRQNVEGTKNVLNFARKLGIPHFHYVSTAYVCGRELDAEIVEGELEKSAIFNNYYEESKFETEKIVREYMRKHKIATNIYRPSIIVGDSKTGKTRSLSGYYTVIRAMYILREKVIKHLHKNDARLKSLNVRLSNGKLYLPLRVAWLKDKPLNLVPIDYVVDTIFEIFRSKDLINKTFFILNPTPPTIQKVLKYTCDALSISAFQTVEPGDFVKHPKTFLERFFLRNVEEYLPYLEIPEPHFKDENTPKVIKGHIAPPVINADFIFKLVNYCIQTNWMKETYLNDRE